MYDKINEKEYEIYTGFFTFYKNKRTGILYLGIKTEQLSKPFIYHSIVESGSSPHGFRGQYRGGMIDNFEFGKLLAFEQYYDRIDLTQKNTNIVCGENSSLYRSEQINVAPSLIATQKIIDIHPYTKEILINASEIFLKEELNAITVRRKKGDGLGDFNKLKNKVYDISNYDENTLIRTEYVYEKSDINQQAAIANANFVSLCLQHAFIKIPENNYQPRVADHRVGYFATDKIVISDESNSPYQHFIKRWNLVKKDPTAELSDPEEPIVWWLENTTPEKWRNIIKEAILSWNQAFEKAGFSNAIVVHIQPDEAEWDAGDIRYNVVRWIAQTTPKFCGYGPCLANPLTGQIICADVSLDFLVFCRSLHNCNLIILDESSSTPDDNDTNDDADLSFVQNIQSDLAFAALSLELADGDQTGSDKLEEDFLRYLVVHEIGHTLGLRHNFIATHHLSPDELIDPCIVQERGICSSIMSYPEANIAPQGKEQTDFYLTKPGVYDIWAIEFGYASSIDNDESRQALLSRSSESELAYATDSEVIHLGGIDPRVTHRDLSNDSIHFNKDRIELLECLFDRLLEYAPKEGKPYKEVLNVYNILSWKYRTSVMHICRYISGVKVNKSVHGQCENTTKPLEAINADYQRQAMKYLVEHVFPAKYFFRNVEAYHYLQSQRQAFQLTQSPSPKIHKHIMSLHAQVLSWLLSSTVQNRIIDSSLYGNGYTLDKMMHDLTAGILCIDTDAHILNKSQYQLQGDYIDRLISVNRDKSNRYYAYAQSCALAQLQTIHTWIKDLLLTNSSEHSIHAVWLKDKFTQAEINFTVA